MTKLITRSGKLQTFDSKLATGLDCCCEDDPHKPPIPGDAPVPGCNACTGNAPRKFQVTTTGISADGSGCSPPPIGVLGCTAYNGTWVLTHTGSVGNSCFWSRAISPTLCTDNPLSGPVIRIVLSLTVSGGVYTMRVFFASVSATFFLWSKNITLKPDCLAFSGETIPGPPISKPNGCKSGGAGCTVSAL